MAYLYVSEQGSVIGVTGNRFEIKLKGQVIQSVPIETLDIIEIFGYVQITTQCLSRCLREGINIVFFSYNGAYFGRLISTNHVNTSRQRKQALLTTECDFSLSIGKSILMAKINNQITILRRYARTNKKVNIADAIKHMNIAIKAINKATTINQIIGHEGYAAKTYFKYLGMLIDHDFAFTGRSRRPPKDPFNSMISLGYSLLLNEIYGRIESKGMNPFWGFIHQDHEKHPTLASDLIEEWRAVIVDSFAMSCINGHEIRKENFEISDYNNGVYLTKEGLRTFIYKLEQKMNTKTKYLSYIDYPLTFRQAIDMQVASLAKAIDQDDPSLYIPFKIR